MQTLLNPAQVQALAATPAQPHRGDEAQLRRTAEDFEATFLSQMLKPMFEGLQTDGPFGGGSAEETWRSFLIDAMARQTVRSGGVGLADRVMSEMLKMQEQAQ